MKDSTKEYLMAGAGFAGLFVKKIVTGTTYNSGFGPALRIQEHWNKAGALREKEKEAEQVPVDGGFYLPSFHFMDSKGSLIEGGIWRKRSTEGTRVLLYKQRGQEEERHWVEWEDIKEYRMK